MCQRLGCLMWLAVVVWLAFGAGPAWAQSARDYDLPPQETGLVNAQVPDITISLSEGDRLLSAVAGRGPLLLTFVFTRCVGMCSPLVRAWRSADKALGSPPGVTRVVLSFDLRDSPEDMVRLARHLGLDGDPAWVFAVAEPGEVARLAEAVGFWWEWDASRRQFDHPALLAGVREGRLVRLLVGGEVGVARLDELYRELSGEVVRSYPLPGRVLFRCFQYDPVTGALSLDWGFALLLLPAVTTMLVTAVLFTSGARARGSQAGQGLTEVRPHVHDRESSAAYVRGARP